MASLKELRERIDSLRATLKITGAMKIISTTQLKKTQRIVPDYFDFLESFINLRKNLKISSEGQTKYLIVIASNRGLCGTFNLSIKNHLKKIIQYNPDLHVGLVGKKLSSVTKTTSQVIFLEETPKDNFWQFGQLILKKLNDMSELRILYTHFHTPLKYELVEKIIFSSTLSSTLEEQAQETYFLKEFNDCESNWIYDYLSVELCWCMLHSNLSEQASRMVSMDGATRNGEDMIDELQLSYNKMRQAMITRELSDIGASTI